MSYEDRIWNRAADASTSTRRACCRIAAEADDEIAALRAKLLPGDAPIWHAFKLGQRVKKKSGSQWRGCVVGWYSTALTPEGYAVESEEHAGSVQIYPASALEAVGGDETVVATNRGIERYTMHDFTPVPNGGKIDPFGSST